MTVATQGRFSLEVNVSSASSASGGDLVVAESPGAVRRVTKALLEHGGPIVSSIAVVAGVTALVTYAPSELALVGTPVLAAAAAGVAAARLFTARTTTTACLSAAAGLVCVAAVATVGSLAAVNNGKAELANAQAAVQTQLTALTAEREALASDRSTLLGTIKTQQRTLDAARATFDNDRVVQQRGFELQAKGLGTQQQLLTAQAAGLDADRKTLNGEKEAFEQRVREAADKLIAPERDSLVAARSALETERNGIVDARLTAVAAEAQALTVYQLKTIQSAIEVYHKDRDRGTTRIVAETYPGTGNATPQQKSILADRVIPTLVNKGYVYAGVITSSSDSWYVVTPANAIKITSVAQLVEHLRLNTQRDLPGPPRAP